MPIDFSKPVTTGNYSTGVIQPVKDAINALGCMLDPAYAGTIISPPTGAKRFNSGAFEEWNGTSWVAAALKASQFLTPRTINGVSFNGTANITIADSTKVPLAGGTMSGPLIVNADLSATAMFVGSDAVWHAGNLDLSGLLAKAGGTMTGKLTTDASAAAAAGMNLPHGAAPTSPVNGDFWTTSAGGFLRVNGTTRTIAFTNSSISGNAATATQLQTARTIALGGNVTGSASFNGATNVTITCSVADNSHTHTQANVDGLVNALGAKASFYTGTLSSLTNYPIGTIVMVDNGGVGNVRNSTNTVRLSSDDSLFTFAGTGAALTGTWRARGRKDDDSLVLMQRVA